MTSDFHSGFICFVGRPNAGKSTLINGLMGHKVAITSSVAQTTRRVLRAILNGDFYQAILVDTPGLHKPQDPLGSSLNRATLEALNDCDGLVWVVDASAPLGGGDEWVCQQLETQTIPKLVVLTKIDKVKTSELLIQRQGIERLLPSTPVLEVSAKKNWGIESLRDTLVRILPEGPPWFPNTMETDQTLEQVLEEMVREKVLRRFRQEVPHSVGVLLRDIDFDPKRNFYEIRITIYCERSSQKAMLIGKNGSALKALGSEARNDMEKFLKGSVYLALNVDVKDRWRRDPVSIKRFGYGSLN